MKYLWLLLTITIIVLIFFNSSLSMHESGAISGRTLDFLKCFTDFFDIHLGKDAEYHIRKLAHFCEFACLSFSMCKTFSLFGIKIKMATGYIFFLCLLVAVLDEYIQLSAEGRSSQITDVLLDFSGVFCMWSALRIWQWAK